MKSPLFSFNIQDFGKGLLMAVLGALISGLTVGLQSGHIDYKAIGLGALSGGLGYLTKNFFSNSNGVPFSPEGK